MNCPQCETVMIEGDADLHGNLWSALQVQRRYVGALRFHEKDAPRSQESKVFDSDERIEAWRCPKCAGVFLKQAPWIPVYRWSSPAVSR